jgi:signal transduction histidine kinase
MIRLATRQADPERAEIIVQDSGVGISPRDLTDVFERFTRGVPQTPEGQVLQVPGMGQGLFISQRVVAAHGGTLRITSQPGRGTRATCSLPLTSPFAMTLKTDLPGVAQPAAVPAARRVRPKS